MVRTPSPGGGDATLALPPGSLPDGASVPCLEASPSVCVRGLGGGPSQSRVIVVIVSLLVS